MMFCPHCGAENQRAKAYCTRCGEWLPDAKSMLLRASSPQETLTKMIVFNGMSAFLGLFAAIALFIMFFSRDVHWGFLAVAAAFSLITAIYQVTSLLGGVKLQRRLKQNRAAGAAAALWSEDREMKSLSAADTSQFGNADSVIERTTELLEPLPHMRKRGRE